ncbi:Glutamate-rich WD repeat-containing protein 1 [Dinochytrium kinnereticum]|nr:Glutamate-rich WD repeat-containing protein 1 [Dinochytrium kinnereticum]
MPSSSASRKRVGDDPTTGSELISASADSPRKRTTAAGEADPSSQMDHDDMMGEFEDAFEDEEDNDEGEVVIAQDSDDEAMEVDGGEPMRDEEEEENEEVQVYLPGQKLDEGEVLVADNSAYEMLHQLQVEWPCLSFDILRDNLGNGRTAFPMTTYVVAGSQAEKAKDNKIYIMKMSDLHRTKHDDDDDADDDDEDLDDDPILESRTIPHMGGVNRIRTMPHPEAHVVSTWSENGKVYIWDISQHVAALDTPGLIPPREPKPIYSVERHGKNEGYAMDWSELGSGRRLLSGDIAGKIYLTLQTPSSFETQAQPFVGHQSSVEDLQWSPKEESVFASCSADKTIRIWDIRTKNKAQISFQAHDCDVNVITWNRITDYLIASGCDSGAFSVWDLRSVMQSAQAKKNPDPAATFKWHQEQITSIEWHPYEGSALVVAGADNQVTLWDLALERDPEEEAVMAGRGGETVEVPPQLLFIHQGQEDVKEVHWHAQMPGVLISTALSGFNVFKTINS